MQVPEDERNEYILDLLHKELGTKLKVGVGRFESLLHAIGLGGGVHDLVRDSLFELAQVRNALIHRGGFADRKLIENCPWLNLNIGDPIRLTMEQFQRYSLSATWYMVEILMRSKP
ncbi:hypothetical protein L0244_19105 [bacterium]|nr:hypothetical protein [bacterium]